MRTVRQRLSPTGRRGPQVLVILENESACQSHRVCKQANTLLEAGYRLTVITRKHPGKAELRRSGARSWNTPTGSDGRSANSSSACSRPVVRGAYQAHTLHGAPSFSSGRGEPGT